MEKVEKGEKGELGMAKGKGFRDGTPEEVARKRFSDFLARSAREQAKKKR